MSSIATKWSRLTRPGVKDLAAVNLDHLVGELQDLGVQQNPRLTRSFNLTVIAL